MGHAKAGESPSDHLTPGGERPAKARTISQPLHREGGSSEEIGKRDQDRTWGRSVQGSSMTPKASMKKIHTVGTKRLSTINPGRPDRRDRVEANRILSQ